MQSKLWQVGGRQGRLMEGDTSLQKLEDRGILRSLETLTFDRLLDVGCCPITEGDCLQPQALHGKLLLVHSVMKLASASTKPQLRSRVPPGSQT